MTTKLDQFLANRRQVLRGGMALGAASMMGGRLSAAPADPISFIGWQFQPQMVEVSTAE